MAVFNKACDYIKMGRAHEASGLLEQIVSEGRGWDEAYSKLGVAYIIQGRRSDAIQAFKKAIEVNDQFVPAYSNVCLALAEEEEFEEAVLYGEKGLEADPSYLPLYSSLAVALKFMGRLDEAISYTRTALSVQKQDVALMSNLAALLYETGQRDEVEKTLLDILKLAPDYTPAHRILSMVKKYKSGDAHLQYMERLNQNTELSSRMQIELNFALGKAHEDVQDYEASAEHYKIANALNHQAYEYSIDQDVAFFDQIKDSFSKEFIAQHQSKKKIKSPIFIVGMPRSSTSLVEQILASHSDVYGAGELNYLDNIQFKKLGLSRPNYTASISKLSEDDFENMANDYTDKLAEVWGAHKHVTDKMPQNFRYLGLIKILFPEAKIIHCMRDPRDICLSIFKTFFAGNLPFAYAEQEIVRYYKLYEDLMAHWHAVLPDEIYDLRYEDLVEDPENTIRNLLDYCDLAWTDQCMEFHNTKRAVTTASAMQVRKPIYKSALQYWKNYEEYFDGLFTPF